MNFIDEFFLKEKIELYSLLHFSDCRVINAEKLKRQVEFFPRSLIISAVPYFKGDAEKRNISLYAISEDYHIYMKDLLLRLTQLLKEKFPNNNFMGFADSSPIDERHAAATGGLGIYGDNGLLISRKYGSYVFICEVFSDLETEKYGLTAVRNSISECAHCGKCKKACPYDECSACLSELTQRKGDLTPHDFQMMKKYNTVWGCDICQSVCPHNENVQKSEIGFFSQNRTPFLTSELVTAMDNDKFARRAYSWRKKDTILRNLEEYEKKDGINEN